MALHHLGRRNTLVPNMPKVVPLRKLVLDSLFLWNYL